MGEIVPTVVELCRSSMELTTATSQRAITYELGLPAAVNELWSAADAIWTKAHCHWSSGN